MSEQKTAMEIEDRQEKLQSGEIVHSTSSSLPSERREVQRILFAVGIFALVRKYGHVSRVNLKEAQQIRVSLQKATMRQLEARLFAIQAYVPELLSDAMKSLGYRVSKVAGGGYEIDADAGSILSGGLLGAPVTLAELDKI